MMQNYGPDIKAAINELFGDGFMSGIDFTIDIERVESSNGARVKLVLDGKFYHLINFDQLT